MADEPELPEGEGPDEQGIAWGKLASAWGIGIVVRGALVVVTYEFFFVCFGYDWPAFWKYLIFVPGAIASALIASSIYPRRSLLAVSAALLIPPDYGAPAGLVLGAAMRLARTRTAQGLVVIGVLVSMIGLTVWFLLANMHPPEPAGVQSEVSRFVQNEVFAPPAGVSWRESYQGTLVGLPNGWSGTVGAYGSKYGGRGRGSTSHSWPGTDDFRVKQICIGLTGPPLTSPAQGSDLADCGVLRRAFAHRFASVQSGISSPVVTRDDYTVTYISSPGHVTLMFNEKR